MKVALIGASGFVGSALLAEALARGHQVTALVQNVDKVAQKNGVTAIKTDVMNPTALAAQLRSHDAVITAFSGHAQTDIEGYYLRGLNSILAATRSSGVARLLVVGGAGSLEVAPGLQLIDTPDFPEQYKKSAEGARKALNLLREASNQDLDWTMLSPAAYLHPGERTAVFRLGTDSLLSDANGKSQISVQDYAVAMIDELEKPAHSRRRFTLAY